MNEFFNRKVNINYKPSSLIVEGWSLEEYEHDGSKCDKDLTPWRWTLDFTCQSLSVTRSISNHRFFSTVEPKESVKIYGKLISTGGEWGQALNYSFLGTDRKIENFELEILEAASDDSEECSLVALPKFEYESTKNFSTLTSEDRLCISIKLGSEKIKNIAKLIDQNILSSFNVYIGDADGLFSHWSPTIYTSFIKILSNECEVEGIDSEDERLKVAGKVGEFSIVYKSKDMILLNSSDEENEFLELEQKKEEANSEHKQWIGSLVTNALSITSSSLKSLTIPLWLVCLLLILLLFK